MTPAGNKYQMGRDTPLMRQYARIKSRYPDSFVLFRLGDFYELFGEDAVKASAVLNITLTSRDKGPDPVPMAGVPHHAVMTYIKKLIDGGHAAVIVDQVEDAKQAKGIVKREVTRVITPGTVLEDELLTADRGNAFAVLVVDEAAGGLEAAWGLAVVDISQGTFVVTGGAVENDDPDDPNYDILPDAIREALDECSRFPVRELLVEESVRNLPEISFWSKDHPGTTISTRRRTADDFWRLDERLRGHLNLGNEIPYPFIGIESSQTMEASQKIRSAALALEYIDETNPRALTGLDRITQYDPSGFLVIDPTTVRNLEIFRTIRSAERKGSLIWALDRTLTPGGRRLLAEWIAFPLLNREKITARHEAVEEFGQAGLEREDVVDALKGVRDIARLARRLTAGNPRPIDSLALGNSLTNIPALKNSLEKFGSKILIDINKRILTHENLTAELNRAIDEEGSLTGKDGGYIRAGYNDELDELRDLMTGGRDMILALQAAEKERTGIKNLKVGFNKVFGYFLEVTKANIGQVPENYIRKQTLANSERYITEELKELESKVLGAEERAKSLEEALFSAVVVQIRKEARASGIRGIVGSSRAF